MISDKMVSFVIPVFNESMHLKEVLSEVDQIQLPFKKEIILIDDCSTDGSKEMIESLQLVSKTIKIYQPKNQGKGAAIRVGIAQATGDIIGIQDADFEYSVRDLPDLMAPFVAGTADVVYGSRFKKNGTQVHRTFHYLVNRFLTMLSNMCSGLYLSDMETCYKFFKREIIHSVILETNRFGFEPEVTAKIGKLKVRVHEVPISYFPRNYMEGKKITWKDGVAAVFHIIRFNFFRTVEQSFDSKLPKQYIPRMGNWL